VTHSIETAAAQQHQVTHSIETAAAQQHRVTHSMETPAAQQHQATHSIETAAQQSVVKTATTVRAQLVTYMSVTYCSNSVITDTSW